MLFLTNLTYCNKYRPFDLHLVILYLVLRNLFKKKKKKNSDKNTRPHPYETF